MRFLLLLLIAFLAACTSPQEASYRADRDASIARWQANVAKIDEAHSYGSSGWSAYGNIWFPPSRSY